MRRYWPIATAALLLGAAVVYGHHKTVEAREWERQVQAVEEFSERLQEEVARTREQAAKDSASAVQWKERADSAQARVPERIVEIREVPVPAECEPFTAVRDTLIDTLVVANEALDSAYEARTAENIALRRALATQTLVSDSLLTTLESRPKPPAWWAPEIRPGAFAGACASGRLCYGFGLTLSWDFP